MRAMEWFVAAVAVVVLGVAAVAAAGGAGEMDVDPVYDTYQPTLPGHPLRGDDLRAVRLGTAVRGYATAQVDDLLERLAREIDERDARIAELGGAPPGPAPPRQQDPPESGVGRRGSSALRPRGHR